MAHVAIIDEDQATGQIAADDAQRFRSAGFDDESYIDVFNTVAIQTSLDRLANSIGVSADDRPLLSGSK